MQPPPQFANDQSEEDTPIQASPSALEEYELPSGKDLAVLEALGGDDDARDFSFQGIKRKLGLHQETLSRALHRLQRDGYVERLEHAYRISPKGLDTISHGRTQEPAQTQPDPYSISLLRARLPSDIDLPELIQSLSYKWFGNLRWLGSTQAPDSATLNWITNDSGVKISVRIKDEVLTIETFPTSANSISDATRSALELFDHVSKAIKSAGRSSGASGVFGRAA